jgi:hypothetical protein
MSSPNTKIDPALQKLFVEFVKKRLGIFGALHFKGEVAKCSCGPCEIFRAIVSGANIPGTP